MDAVGRTGTFPGNVGTRNSVLLAAKCTQIGYMLESAWLHALQLWRDVNGFRMVSVGLFQRLHSAFDYGTAMVLFVNGSLIQHADPLALDLQIFCIIDLRGSMCW